MNELKEVQQFMLKIRDEQIEAFRKARRRAAADWAWDALQPIYPELLDPESKAGGLDRLEQAICQAEALRITSDPELLRWIGLTLALGPNFPAAPEYLWTSRILDLSTMDAGRRLDAVFAGIKDQLREALLHG